MRTITGPGPSFSIFQSRAADPKGTMSYRTIGRNSIRPWGLGPYKGAWGMSWREAGSLGRGARALGGGMGAGGRGSETLGMGHSFGHLFDHSLVCSFVSLFVCLVARPFICSFVRSFVHSFIRLFIRSDGRKFSYVFYRTSSPSGPLPKKGQRSLYTSF